MNRRSSLSKKVDPGQGRPPTSSSEKKSKKASSAEPFSMNSNCSASSTGSVGSRGKKKKFSFFSNLFKSKIPDTTSDDQDQRDIEQLFSPRKNGHSSSYESVNSLNSIATTNSFSFVSPKKYKGKGNKGKRIPVDDPTLPTPDSGLKGRVGDGKNENGGGGTLGRRQGKMGTLSRLGAKIGLKKKYNLQSCESLENIVAFPQNSKGKGHVKNKKKDILPIKTTINPPSNPTPDRLEEPPTIAPVSVEIPPDPPTSNPAPIGSVEVVPDPENVQNTDPESTIIVDNARSPSPSEPVPGPSSSVEADYDSSGWGTNTRRKRRAPLPPSGTKALISTSPNMAHLPGKSGGTSRSEGGLEMKSNVKRESYPSGALRRQKLKDKRPCSCSNSIFAHHSRYQQQKRCYCSDSGGGGGSCSATVTTNTGTRTRAHVQGKKKAPPPPNPFDDYEDLEESGQSAPKQEPVKVTPKCEVMGQSKNSGNGSKNPYSNPFLEEDSSEQEVGATATASVISPPTSDQTPLKSGAPVTSPPTAPVPVVAGLTKSDLAISVIPAFKPKSQKSDSSAKIKTGVKGNGSNSKQSENSNPDVSSTTSSSAPVFQLRPGVDENPAPIPTVVDQFNNEDAEIAQNILNDRQEQELQLLSPTLPQNAPDSGDPSVSTSATIATSSVTSTASTTNSLQTSTSAHTTTTTKSSRLFNFSKSKASTSNPASSTGKTAPTSTSVPDGALEEAQNELEALLHSSDTLKAQATKVDAEVKAQLVQLKNESDKSPLLFFSPKSRAKFKKDSSQTPTDLQNGTTTPVHSPSASTASDSSSSETKTPRPWYKRSISISSSKNKPKVPPKPTITLLPKFSDLDREAKQIVEENRRKSAELQFNQNARDLINIFNTAFTPPQEEAEDATNMPSNPTTSSASTAPSPITNGHLSSPSTTTKPSDSNTTTAYSTTTSATMSTSSPKPVSINAKPMVPCTSDQNNVAVVQPQSKLSPTSPTSSTPTPTSTTSSSALVFRYTNSHSLSSTTTAPTSTSTSASVLSASVSPSLRTTTATAAASTASTATPVPVTSVTSTSGVTQATVAVPSSATTTSLSTSISSSGAKPSGDSWTCSRCTLKNSAWRALCEACYQRKIPLVTNTSSMTSFLERVNANRTPQITSTSISTTTTITSVATASTPKTPSTTQTGPIPTPNGTSVNPDMRKPIQPVKPKSSNTPSCENFLSQLPSKASLMKDKALEQKDPGVKLKPTGSSTSPDPEVEELDIAQLRQVRLAFFAKDDKESQKNNLALHSTPRRNSVDGHNQAKGQKLNVFSDGEDDSIDTLLQLQPQPPSTAPPQPPAPKEQDPQGPPQIPAAAAPRVQSPVPFRFRPMLEAISETETNFYSTREFDRIYENWQLGQIQRERVELQTPSGYNPSHPHPHPGILPPNVSHLQMTQMSQLRHIQPNANVFCYAYPYPPNHHQYEGVGESESLANFRLFNNPIHSDGSGTFLTDPHSAQSRPTFNLIPNPNSPNGDSEEDEGEMDRRRRSGYGQWGERQLSYDDYRKLGAVPKGFGGRDSPRFTSGSGSRQRSRRQNEHEDDDTPYFSESSSEFSSASASAESTTAVSKLLRKLEWAIAHGEHRLAATLAHDLALLQVNCVAAKPNNQPITIRVYVEDRFMQQGPFLVQVTLGMTVKDLKSKIEGDWGIPAGFQKWILGKKMAEEDLQTLAHYDVVQDTMAFLYLVTPQIENIGQLRNIDSPPPLLPKKPVSRPSTPQIPSSRVRSLTPGTQDKDRPPPKVEAPSSPKISNSPITKPPLALPTPDPVQDTSQPHPQLPLPLPPKKVASSAQTETSLVPKRVAEPTEDSKPETGVQVHPSVPKPPSPNPIQLYERPLPPSGAAIEMRVLSHQYPLHRNSPIKETTSRASPVPRVLATVATAQGPRRTPEKTPIPTSSVKSLVQPDQSQQKPRALVSTSTPNKANLSLSLQAKLANLREAAEQAFGKSFGQTTDSVCNTVTTMSSSNETNRIENLKKQPTHSKGTKNTAGLTPKTTGNRDCNSNSNSSSEGVRSSSSKSGAADQLAQKQSGKVDLKNNLVLQNNDRDKLERKKEPAPKNVDNSPQTNGRIISTKETKVQNLNPQTAPEQVNKRTIQNPDSEVPSSSKVTKHPENKNDSPSCISKAGALDNEPVPRPRAKRQSFSSGSAPDSSQDKETPPGHPGTDLKDRVEQKGSTEEFGDPKHCNDAASKRVDGCCQTSVTCPPPNASQASQVISTNTTATNQIVKAESASKPGPKTSPVSTQVITPPPSVSTSTPSNSTVHPDPGKLLSHSKAATTIIPGPSKPPLAIQNGIGGHSPGPTVGANSNPRNECLPREISEICDKKTDPTARTSAQFPKSTAAVPTNTNPSVASVPLSTQPKPFKLPYFMKNQSEEDSREAPSLSFARAREFHPTSSPVLIPGSLQRKNSDSSIINMDVGSFDRSLEFGGGVGTASPVAGAAALPDDKKEDNIQTYLSMLQLMEKEDLIKTVDEFECPVCFLPVAAGQGVTLRDCLHTFCKECLVGAVNYAEESEVKCPFRDNNYSCNSALQEREIKALVPGEIFEKYLTRSVKLAERKMMNTFHCVTSDCTGWCVFEDDVNTFNCPVCKKRNCITCAAIHEGVDCQQYQRQLAIAAETDENAKSSRLMLEKMIQRGEALECPACHVVLLKKWGCDWVRCSYCKTEICWVTKGFRWGPGGKGDMSGGCKCGLNGIRCHPKCTYCH